MKVICSKSNIEFTISHFRTITPISAEHPLLSAPFSTLLELASLWRKRALSTEESRLLFIALLNSSQRLRWKCAATPTIETVEKYMEYLLVTINWKVAIGNRLDKAFPEIHITHDTRYLEQIGTYLTVWNNIQREETQAIHLQALRTDIAIAQKKLLHLIHDGREGDALFLRHLFKWFSVASNVPRGIVEYWEKLFLLERPAIWGASLTDLDEMKEHCEEKLFRPASKEPISSYAMAAYKHICKQERDCREGVLGALGSFSPTDGNLPYTIISSSLASKIEEEERKIVEEVGEKEPRREEFSSSTEFLRARSRWKLRSIILEDRARSSSATKDNDNSKIGETEI